MTTKQVIIAFLVLYLILMGVGGAMYYFIVNAPKPQAQAKTQTVEANKNAKGAKTEVKETDKKTLDTETLKKQKEEEEKKARELEEKKRKEEKERIEKLKASIEAKMKVVERGGATYYTGNRGKELSGVHLRPFIVENNGAVFLKHDIYYYSALDDPNYGWIHGSHLDVTADGQTFSYELDVTKRRDKLGKGAEDLTEHYVADADKNVEDMLRAVGGATSVTLRYYGGSDIVSNLSREDIRRIYDMMTLYDILKKEANGDL